MPCAVVLRLCGLVPLLGTSTCVVLKSSGIVLTIGDNTALFVRIVELSVRVNLTVVVDTDQTGSGMKTLVRIVSLLKM